MSASKVTLSIDGSLLARVRERAVRKRGKLRSLSEEVEEALRDSFANEQLELALRELCCGRDDHIEVFSQVEAIDFGPGPSAQEIIREMRRRRG
jgi:hypothetical protein